MRVHHGVLPGALDLYFDIAALQLELGNILFDEELDEFFQLFLIHWITVGPSTYRSNAPEARQTLLRLWERAR